MIVFVIEKPMLARALAQPAIEKYPDQRIFTLTAHPYRTFAFNYGRGYRWNEFPRTDFTRVTLRRDAPLSIHEITNTKVVEHTAADRERAARELLFEADQIVYAGDPDHSGAYGFYELLLRMTSLERAHHDHPALMLTGLAKEDIALAFSQSHSTNDPEFSRLRDYGEVKRYFDYNYNLNSLAIFGKVLADLGIAKAGLLSKYGLQLLYFLRDSGPIKETAVIKAMQTWHGTGRYPVEAHRPELGSPASRVQIVVDLARNGLIDLSVGSGTRNQTVTVSEKGVAFIEALHPDCRDPDLPFRLHRWCVDDKLKSTSAINRYFRNFFGKQKHRMDDM